MRQILNTLGNTINTRIKKVVGELEYDIQDKIIDSVSFSIWSDTEGVLWENLVEYESISEEIENVLRYD